MAHCVFTSSTPVLQITVQLPSLSLVVIAFAMLVIAIMVYRPKKNKAFQHIAPDTLRQRPAPATVLYYGGRAPSHKNPDWLMQQKTTKKKVAR
jgi:hypothetical protein